MIRQLANYSTDSVPHTENLKASIQSLFRFQEEAFPNDLTRIDLTTITYINYKKIIEMVKNAITILKSEVVSIDPPSLKDALLVLRLAMDRVQYNLNLIDTRLEHLKEYLENQSSWKRHLSWTQASDAHQRYQKLLENQKKMKEIWGRLQDVWGELQRTVRQVALAIVKAEVSQTESYWIIDIEALEESRASLEALRYEIEMQVRQAEQTNRIIYFEPERIRIFNTLQKASYVIKTLSFQLSKVHLDSAFLTPALLEALKIEEEHQALWKTADRNIFKTLVKLEAPLKILLEALDRLLAPESQKLNIYANRVAGLGWLMSYSPVPTLSALSPKPRPTAPPKPNGVTAFPPPGTPKPKARVAELEESFKDEKANFEQPADEADDSILTLGFEEVEEAETRQRKF